MSIWSVVSERGFYKIFYPAFWLANESGVFWILNWVKILARFNRIGWVNKIYHKCTNTFFTFAYARQCLLISRLRHDDVMMTSSWHNITWMYVGERNNSIGALVIYFIDSSDPIETCKNFYSVLGSTLVWFVSQWECNIGILCRNPFQIRHFRLTWRSTFSFFYILDWDSLLPMIRKIF